jgi:hypothetical protein
LIYQLFFHFDKNAFASASMAQVHKAILKNGERIVLKIQRPNIRKIIIEDINKNPNYSGSDLQRADDILFHICMKIFAEKDQNTIITNLAEQLSDIVTSGSCPQGRVNRLMQLYLAFQLQG